MPLNLTALSRFAGSPASAPKAESKPAQPALSRTFARKTDDAELTGRALVAAAAQDTSVLTLDDARPAAKALRVSISGQAAVAVLAQANQGSRLALGLLG